MRPERSDPGSGAFCPYGMKHIRKGYTALKKEVSGAQAGYDATHIHRMRVASRRMRAALPIFSSCLPKKPYRRWFRAVKTITRSLGRARDLDVQIAFLEEYIRKTSSRCSEPHVPGGNRSHSGLPVLLETLKSGRAAIQPEIEAIAVRFSDAGVFSDLPGAIREAAPLRQSRTSIRKRAARETGRRYAALIAFDRSARDPEAVEAHHAMRIAAKKYRYTMEIFDEACGGRYSETIKAVRKIQEILGLMHDCDVWIATIEEQGLPHEEVSGEKPGESGLIALLEDRKEDRNVQYRKFLFLWEKFRQKDPAGEGSTSSFVGKSGKK